MLTHPGPTHPPTPSVPDPQPKARQMDLLTELAAGISISAPPRTKRSLGPRPAWERFWEKVDLSGDCWIWKASTNERGYGQFTVLGTPIRPHRWAYQMLVGTIPPGMQLDHVCHSLSTDCPSDATCIHRRCVNPAHLEPVTPRENTLRSNSVAASYASRSECNQGHPYDSANTRITTEGARICRRCHANAEAIRRGRTPR